MAACARAGIQHFAINTHHLPDAWNRFIKRADVWNIDITLFHEPFLLETGGGLKNIAAWVDGDPLLVHNGDIFSTMHLDKLIAAHEASGLPVTLALRSQGIARHIAINAEGTRVTDIRKMLGHAEGTHVFTGIYCVNPGFLDQIPADVKISVIPAFLELAKVGKLGTIILDQGVWLDLGNRDSYLQAHRELALAPAIHAAATVEPGAMVERSIIGPGAVVAAGAVVRDSVIWPGGRVAGDAVLERCIVYSGNLAKGFHQDCDI